MKNSYASGRDFLAGDHIEFVDGQKQPSSLEQAFVWRLSRVVVNFGRKPKGGLQAALWGDHVIKILEKNCPEHKEALAHPPKETWAII
jgi:hypothetical protein